MLKRSMDYLVEIKGYPNYIIYWDGRIYSLKSCKFLRYYIDTKGYQYVYLYKNNKRKFLSVHRLLAMHFIPNPNNLPCVNHKDGNKKNNNLKNLEWCTYKQNNEHARNTGLWASNKGEQHGGSKLSKTEVLEIKELHNLIPQKDIADAYNVSYHTIKMIHYGYLWKHLTKEII